MFASFNWRRVCAAVVIIIAAMLWLSVPALAAGGTADRSPVIVLVPGFFNSLAPGRVSTTPPFAYPYFSGTIVGTLDKFGTVLTVNNLLPVGTVEQNGEILERFLVTAAEKHPGRKMVLIAHSAGGLYAMRALTARPELPVETVVTIATPYGGVELVDNVAAQAKVLDTLAIFLNLESLRQFKKAKVAAMIAGFALPDRVRWITLAGTQPPCRLAGCGDARNLSWILTLAQGLMKNASDGIVTFESALGRHVGIRAASGRPFALESWADFNFALEHWEMVSDSRLFTVLGVMNSGYINDMQIRFFERIFERLGMRKMTENIHD